MRNKKPNQTDLEFLQLKGPVKQLMQTVYKATKNGTDVIPGKIEVDHGSEDKNFIYTFSSDGNIAEEEIYGNSFRTVNTFDKLGRRIVEKKYYQGNHYTTNYLTYLDNTPLIIESVTNDAGGNLMYRYTNTYTDTEQVLEHMVYHVKHGLEFLSKKQIYTYRDEIKIIQNRKWREPLTNIEYDKDGKIIHSHTSTYNEKGQCIERVTLYTDSSIAHMSSKTTYVYNEQGDVIETNMYHADGTLKNSYVSTPQYDSEGKKVQPPPPVFHDYQVPDSIHLDVPGTVKDDKGNWIKKIISQGNLPAKYVIRELVYEGEDKKLEHPLTNPANIETEVSREPSYESYKLEKDEAKWIAEWPSFTPDNFPYARYYTLRFHEAPSLVIYQGPHIEAMMLLKKLQDDLFADIVHSYTTVWNGNNERMQRYTLCFPNHWGYMLHCHGMASHNIDEFSLPDDFEDTTDGDYVYTSQFSLLRPGNVSRLRDEGFEEQLSDIIDKCSLRKKPEKPVINIIEVKNGNYTTKEYAVHDNFIIKDLDVNYGHGFEKFHNDLMQRFNSSTKGLVLFHGIPGTGKTFYIRHLLRKMVANRKDVIYIPPNMVDHLVDPAFMTFLSNELKSWSEEGHTCVLLIEDAEPLLAKRQEGIRIQGVTNLLNMTDGLLNDMLNIQIICTFNVDLQKLDSALLRPGRLIARKEFKALSVLDANLLAQRLGIKHHFKKPATLGEIYAMRKNHDTLVHDVEQDKGASKAIDDL